MLTRDELSYLVKLLEVLHGEVVVESMDDIVIFTHDGALSPFSLTREPEGWVIQGAKNGDVVPLHAPRALRHACRTVVEAMCAHLLDNIEDAAADAWEEPSGRTYHAIYEGQDET